MTDADTWIKKLALEPHPEMGYFREVMRSPEMIASPPERYDGPRCFYTSIYFLLKQGQKNYLHRLQSDELWYFHAGSPLTLHVITPAGDYSTQTLGLDVDAGQMPQGMVRAGDWFGATVDEGDYTLVGCMVAPGFDFADFEMGGRDDLLKRYPQHETIIQHLCKPPE